ncbi:MAG: type II secretion system protein [Bacillota bacterium]|nr:type II secretion system protein [Bacillota bacterium]
MNGKENLAKDNRGVTLTEMIVTFALVGIFMAAAVSVISSAIVTHSELTASMYAQSVGEMLLDKVTGELAAARAGEEDFILIGDTARLGGTEGNGAAFCDRDGKLVVCLVEDGLLRFRYWDAEESLNESNFPQNEWSFDEKAYMGFRITDMQIHKVDEKNVLEINVKIKNLKTGFEYSTSRCTRCYNFKSDGDYQRITEDNSL